MERLGKDVPRGPAAALPPDTQRALFSKQPGKLTQEEAGPSCILSQQSDPWDGSL